MGLAAQYMPPEANYFLLRECMEARGRKRKPEFFVCNVGRPCTKVIKG